MEDSGRLDIYLQTGKDGLRQSKPDFQKFPKIPRLNRDIIITEKIDGTNAQLLITEDGRIFPGSRKRYLTIENDNYGFAAWVVEHEQELLELGPGRHFGEWWGRGINRNYGLDHKRFSLFNVSRWVNLNSIISYLDLGVQDFPPICCNVVPILWAGLFSQKAIVETLDGLGQYGSIAVPGFMKPEGIVVYHTAGNNLFKVTLEGDKKPKEKNNDSM